MLTVKVTQQKEYILPQHCAYCNAKLQEGTSWGNNSTNKIRKLLLSYTMRNSRCTPCTNLQSKSLMYTQMPPLVALVLVYYFYQYALSHEILGNDLLGFCIVMAVLIVAIVITDTIGKKLANNFLTKQNYPWKAKSISKGPVRINNKLKEKGFLVLDFINDDYGRAFVELNHGQVL